MHDQVKVRLSMVVPKGQAQPTKPGLDGHCRESPQLFERQQYQPPSALQNWHAL
eukprot:CAMPEP_0174694580 /NCGR_PEP_ID=MMETSP1094-20130205/1145_1 /TAXON_ID=156173 /ORGANISM="Chrysochromulina brevifilum, Strain UTEX LB 985" /LENGTH=53 /DNA_ID=CAMNT_0015890857 /DNA_START=323 /DNA_END=484 /DNA_ORIENTATION=+